MDVGNNFVLEKSKINQLTLADGGKEATMEVKVEGHTYSIKQTYGKSLTREEAQKEMNQALQKVIGLALLHGVGVEGSKTQSITLTGDNKATKNYKADTETFKIGQQSKEINADAGQTYKRKVQKLEKLGKEKTDEINKKLDRLQQKVVLYKTFQQYEPDEFMKTSKRPFEGEELAKRREESPVISIKSQSKKEEQVHQEKKQEAQPVTAVSTTLTTVSKEEKKSEREKLEKIINLVKSSNDFNSILSGEIDGIAFKFINLIKRDDLIDDISTIKQIKIKKNEEKIEEMRSKETEIIKNISLYDKELNKIKDEYSKKNGEYQTKIDEMKEKKNKYKPQLIGKHEVDEGLRKGAYTTFNNQLETIKKEIEEKSNKYDQEIKSKEENIKSLKTQLVNLIDETKKEAEKLTKLNEKIDKGFKNYKSLVKIQRESQSNNPIDEKTLKSYEIDVNEYKKIHEKATQKTDILQKQNVNIGDEEQSGLFTLKLKEDLSVIFKADHMDTLEKIKSTISQVKESQHYQLFKLLAPDNPIVSHVATLERLSSE